MGVDLDGNGIGEPVKRWGKPFREESGKWKEEREYQASNSNGNPYISSDFIDEFSPAQDKSLSTFLSPLSSKLHPAWQWNHNPDDAHWSLTKRKGFLTIDAQPADSLKACRNMLTQKVVGYLSESTTIVEAKGDCYAGLCFTGKLFTGIGLCKKGVFIEQNGQRSLIKSGSFPRLYLKVINDSQQNRHQYFYSIDGESYLPACDPFPLRAGYWKGIRVGLFCYGPDGMAQFDTFRQSVLK